MHVDLDTTAASQSFNAPICIIGGGIAGLVLATRLATRGIDVHLLEAGGLILEERSQALYNPEMGRERHTGCFDGRFRTFGGSSTRWGGQLLPFTEDIFGPAPGCPSLPWPIHAAELAPYYEQAEALLAVDRLPFTDDLLPALGHAKPPASTDIVTRFSKWMSFKTRNLANTLGAEALAHPRITVYTHANAASLHGDAGRIQSVRVLNYAGAEFTFTADEFVCTSGTVENARLLLASPGVPNPHGQIGLYFHDHVGFHAAQFASPARERILELVGPYYVDGTLHSAKFEASPSLRGAEGLLAVMAHVVIEEPEDSGTAAIRNLLQSLQRGRVKDAIFANLLPVFRGAGDVLRLVYYSRFKKRRAVSKRATVWLNIDVEQGATAENRIRLSKKTDALGLPIAVVDWSIRDPEQHTAVRYAHFIRQYLEAANLAPTDWHPGIAGDGLPAMNDTYHAMGGLRMGLDPTTSVVDPSLRFHGLENLYVASCAVFPSGSSSNPTFTMIALTLRLAELLTAKKG